jgi:hypothetical protein
VFRAYTSAEAGAASSGGTVSPVRASGPGGWEPSVLYLMGLLIAEVVAAAFLTRYLLG